MGMGGGVSFPIITSVQSDYRARPSLALNPAITLICLHEFGFTTLHYATLRCAPFRSVPFPPTIVPKPPLTLTPHPYLHRPSPRAQAAATLHWLNTLAEHADVLPAFLQPDTCGRAAYACVHFLELLVGERCAKLSVERPQQYGFDRAALLDALAGLALRLAAAPRFVAALAAEPDLDGGVLHTALKVWAKGGVKRVVGRGGCGGARDRA
eukprot:70045-Chlamydomonas_euryale.AAC.1